MAPLNFFLNSFETGDASALFSPWSFVHLASGIFAGGVAAFYTKHDAIAIGTLSAVWLVLVVVWELFEYVGNKYNSTGWAFTEEHPVNKLTDISIGLLGFALLLLVSRVDVV
mgnify:CR=1 FL=1